MISVIIPTYNRAQLLGETLQSLMNQTFQDFEVLVIDDDSTDQTEEVVKEFSVVDLRFKFFKRPSGIPKGGNSCRNYGFDLAKGTYLKWIDSDDLLVPNALKLQVESLMSSGCDLSICSSRVFFDGDIQKTSKVWGNIESEATVSNFLQAKFRWHTGAGLWRKSYFSNTPPWKEGLMNSQEWLMHVTQLVNRVKLVKIFNSLCLVRAHKGSMSHVGNKSSSYFYNECMARNFLFCLLLKHSVEIRNPAKKKVTRQFVMYHVFTLYKGSISYFFKALRFYPSFFNFLLKY